jgi:hypothetical protein
MAAYPTLPLGSGSGEDWLDDLSADRSESGKVKVRAFYPTKKRRFTVRHPGLTLAQRNTLETFYNANRLLTFTFTWAADGLTYTCVFGGPVKFDYPGRGPLGNATVTLLET